MVYVICASHAPNQPAHNPSAAAKHKAQAIARRNHDAATPRRSAVQQWMRMPICLQLQSSAFPARNKAPGRRGASHFEPARPPEICTQNGTLIQTCAPRLATEVPETLQRAGLHPRQAPGGRAAPQTRRTAPAHRKLIPYPHIPSSTCHTFHRVNPPPSDASAILSSSFAVIYAVFDTKPHRWINRYKRTPACTIAWPACRAKNHKASLICKLVPGFQWRCNFSVAYQTIGEMGRST